METPPGAIVFILWRVMSHLQAKLVALAAVMRNMPTVLQ
ncbi:hypothetical protein Hsar01_00040 [Haloferula sargassicola]|uniref:Uncharacterized protein n=1 Tax=Haloferula sargassicola TaxID=490096 RepID=A0ABP9UGP5_9BACT